MEIQEYLPKFYLNISNENFFESYLKKLKKLGYKNIGKRKKKLNICCNKQLKFIIFGI